MQLTVRETIWAGPAIRHAAVAVFVALLFGALTVLGCGSADARQVERSSGNFYEDALARYTQGDFSGAVIQLKNALRDNPANLPARILIGRAYLKLGDAFSAEKELRRARIEGADEELLIVPLASAMYLLKLYEEVLDELSVRDRGRDVEAGLRIVRGQAYLSLLKMQEAEVEFQRAAELRPEAAMPMVGLARVYMTRGQMRAARKSMKGALAAEPENFYVWFVDGQVSRRLGLVSAALASFDKALALEPNHTPARIARARLLIEAGRYKEVAPDLDALRAMLPNNPLTAYLDALVKLEQKDREGHQHALNRADSLLRGMDREQLFKDPSLLLLAGVVNYALKNYNDAHNFLREHIVRDRFHAGSRILLGRLLLRRGSTRDALTMFQTAVDLAPYDPEARRLVGIALMRLGHYDEATAALKKAIELNPNATSLRTALALSQLRRGESGDAIAGLEEALENESDSAEPGMMLGLILVRERKYEEALDVLKKEAARDPENPVLYNLMSSALWARGEAEKARENLERAIALNPEYLSAHRNLARMDLQAGNIAAAKARFQAMVDMPGAKEQPLVDLANIAIREGKFRDALSLLTKARDKAPDNVPVQLDMIDLLARSGDGDAALRNARKLDNKLADNPSVIEKLGSMELIFGKREEAAIAFRRLSEAVSDDADAYLRVARYQIRAADLHGAHNTLKRALVSNGEHMGVLEEVVNLEAQLDLFEDALLRTRLLIKQFPDRAIGYRLRGDVLAKQRQFGDAAHAFEAAIEKEPSGALHVRYYHAQRGAGVKQPSLKPLENWVNANPKDYGSRRTLASAYMNSGRTAEATLLYEQLSTESTGDAVVLNNLAWLYYETGDERALETAEKAYRLAPKQAQTLDTYGWILVQSGDSARGLELLRDAFARASRRPSLRYHLAVALAQQGQFDEAMEHLEAVLKSKKVKPDIAEKSRELLTTLQRGG